MKILTFNHHEAYLCSMAATGHQFEVVHRYGELDLAWAHNNRQKPENMELVVFDDSVKNKLKSGYYDVVVCHTIKNLLWLFAFYHVKFIFVAHIPLFFHTPQLFIKAICKKIFYRFFSLTHSTLFVADSEFKRKMWREKGDVIVLTPEAIPEKKSLTNNNKIVYVGNFIKERGKELGYELLEPILNDFPITVIGNNPEIKDHILPRTYDEYLASLLVGSIYLYTIRQPFGDGYNTAMLEAMSVGMPVVTIENPSSPILHNINGLVVNNVQEMKEALVYLLKNPDEIKRLGFQAQETVKEKFSNEQFTQKWNQVLAKV